MAGNVEEWVADWFDGSYYQGAPRVSPKGPDSGRERVLRGGPWNGDPGDLRAAYRNGISPSVRLGYASFRCAQ